MIHQRPEAPVPTEPSSAGKHLTFLLGEETYAIPVLKVREIIRHTAITPVPQMPRHIRGVLNLRGKVIPVVDLRVRFGMGDGLIMDRTCIVVVQAVHDGKPASNTGLIVDSVMAVAAIPDTDIEPTPHFGGQHSTECILGMAKLEDRVVTLLDIDRVLATAVPGGTPRPGTPISTPTKTS